jgi:hypothetical protein
MLPPLDFGESSGSILVCLKYNLFILISLSTFLEPLMKRTEHVSYEKKLLNKSALCGHALLIIIVKLNLDYFQ